jgi:hypothetical protein
MMPHYKSVQYAVYCDFCTNIIDYEEYKNLKRAERDWRSLGWRKRGYNDGKAVWMCPSCIDLAAMEADDA